jgi:hypothetical protein
MRAFRARSSIAACFVLVWQLVAVMLVPTALCCRQTSSVAAASQPGGGMMNCPLHHGIAAAADPVCPLHAAKPAAECHCPTIGCSQTDEGFMSLYGPIGVLPAPPITAGLSVVGRSASLRAASTFSLAPVPLAPPPRA